jgi:hypothetical protein
MVIGLMLFGATVGEQPAPVVRIKVKRRKKEKNLFFINKKIWNSPVSERPNV